MTSVLIFGDSIVFGVGDSCFQGGWVGRLKPLLEKKNRYLYIFNLGVPGGERLSNIRKRLPVEVRMRFKKNYEDANVSIIIAAGLNDTLLNSGKPQTSKKGFINEIEKIVWLSRQYTSKIAWLGLLPVAEDKIRDSCGTLLFKNQFIQEYNSLLEKNCDRFKVYFFNLYPIFNNNNFYNNLLSEDGIHPNGKGYRKIATLVFNFICENSLAGL